MPDDGELRRLFSKQGVEFAWRPHHDSFTDYLVLYRTIGVRSLATTAKAQAQWRRRVDPDALPPLITNASKRAICYYLRNENRKQYERVKQAGALEQLLRTREQAVEGLTVSYSLGRETLAVPSSSAYWDQGKRVLYRSSDCSLEQLEVELPIILSRELIGGQTSGRLENFIGRVLGASDEKADALIRRHSWSLPQEEKQWVEEILAISAPPPEVEQGAEPEATVHPVEQQAGGAAVGSTGRASISASQPRTPGSTRHRRGSTPGQQTTTPPREHTYRPRLRSYVERAERGTEDKALERSGLLADREAVEKAGIEVAMAYERTHERVPEELPPNHEGWDINSFEESPVAAILDKEEKQTLARYIEVKATSHAWDGWGVGLTAPEYRAAQVHGERYYLYVVEHALNEELRRLYIFRNPVDKVSDYRLDDKWKAAADDECELDAVAG